MYRAPWVYTMLIAAILAVYGQTYRYDFVNYDDPEYVTENAHVTSGLTASNVVWAFTSAHSANWHPLTWLSHMLDCQLFGLRAGGHHLVNVGLHVGNSLLLFGLLLRLTGTLGASALVAALFALHPLHVESVAWIAERKDVLSTLFWMLTLWAYVGYVRQPALGRYILVLLGFTLGLMAKPMVVTLPFVLLLLDVWPLDRLSFDRPLREPLRRLVWEKLPLFALAAAASAITVVVQRAGGAVASTATFPMSFRIGNAAVSYVTYIGMMLWPSGLAVFYPAPFVLSGWRVAASALGLAFATWLVLRTAARRPYLLVGWLWYLGTLLPVIGIVRAGEQFLADRFTYVPLIGLFICVAWGVPDLLNAWGVRRTPLPSAAVAVTAVYAVVTWFQVQHWQNTTTLFRHTLAVTTDNYLAHTNLGVALVGAGQMREAREQFTAALHARSDYSKAHLNLGMSLAAEGQRAAAIDHYREALRLEPDSAMAHYNLGLAFAEQGQLDEAVAHYGEALRLNPQYAKAHTNLGWTLAAQGKLEEAATHYRIALRIEPDLAAAHNNLGVALEGLGQADEALVHYREVARLLPDDPRARFNLAATLQGRGELADAAKEYAAALRVQPHFADAHYGLGTTLAALGKSIEAAAEYRAALHDRPDWPEATARLAALSAADHDGELPPGSQP